MREGECWDEPKGRLFVLLLYCILVVTSAHVLDRNFNASAAARSVSCRGRANETGGVQRFVILHLISLLLGAPEYTLWEVYRIHA